MASTKVYEPVWGTIADYYRSHLIDAMTDRNIRTLIQQKKINPEKGDQAGIYELRSLNNELIKYLSRPPADPKAANLTQAKLRRETAAARKAELQVQQLEQTLLHRDDVLQTWTNALTIFKTQALGLEQTLVQELEGIEDPLQKQEIIKRNLRQFLEDLADNGITRSTNAVEDSSPEPEAAA